MSNVPQLSAFPVRDDLTTQKNLPFLLTFLRVPCVFKPPCTEEHCHFMSIYSFISFCVFIWSGRTGVTYLGHSLRVIYWPGIVFIVFVSHKTF